MSPTTDPARRAIIDTDTFSSLFRNDANAERIRVRMIRQTAGTIFLTEITAEETRGKWGGGYALLVGLIQELAQYPFLPYDDAADRIYRSFSAAVKRTGSADCKIAAVAQAHDAVVVTRNVRRYASVPGTLFEDWTTPVYSPT
ncbi:MAG: type II toxin-antitoxin system VapC family toxin [Akkermansiaceae bacterium]|nr:type II toxin-antitoxin system VapC family toxin [Armatimonadota bacterium]